MSKTVDEIERSYNSDSTSSCQVVDCSGKVVEDPVSVWLEKRNGDEYLFSGKFCKPHYNGFCKAPGILVNYIKHGQIRGIDPHILD